MLFCTSNRGRAAGFFADLYLSREGICEINPYSTSFAKIWRLLTLALSYVPLIELYTVFCEQNILSAYTHTITIRSKRFRMCLYKLVYVLIISFPLYEGPFRLIEYNSLLKSKLGLYSNFSIRLSFFQVWLFSDFRPEKVCRNRVFSW